MEASSGPEEQPGAGITGGATRCYAGLLASRAVKAEVLQQRVAVGKMLPVFLLTRGVGAGAAPPPLSVVERQGSARRL